jgi:serine/threonine protein kinase
MKPTDRWQQIEDLFHATLERAPSERESFLAAACPADAELRTQVETLLRVHRSDENPLDSPALELAAKMPVAETGAIGVGSVVGHYQILSPLGQGGMGAVYLAMHLGTRRYVALKVIAPQLMAQQEFVTRFRREAEAAGRLRHPNVVDVTDFGFARLGATDIAYLVMEYLDGCTLADILAEEERLPLMWVVDILEQVCSAVDEAHQQGTIHRDLKPENIWLEPNRRGGYTVKVLDFGLAKLAPSSQVDGEQSASLNETSAPLLPKVSGEAATLALPREPATKEMGKPARETQDETAMMTAPTDGLTRIGALMGTPLYMSPEQCRGQRLGPQSDIYSLGVIAYQMLSGQTPFTGEMEGVIKSHLETPARPLREVCPKTPKKIAALIMSALDKDPAKRPPSAAAFASSLRACSEGTGTLLRRTFAIYSEYLPTFLRISAIAYLPAIALGLIRFGCYLLIRNGAVPAAAGMTVSFTLNLLFHLVNFLCSLTALAVIVPIIIQLIVMPLRPIQIQSRAAFDILRRRLRPYITTALLATLCFFGGLLFLIVPGIVMNVLFALYAPIVIVENLKNWAALRRSMSLVQRTPGTVILMMLFQFVIPGVVGSMFSILITRLTRGNPDLGASLIVSIIALSNVMIMPLIVISLVLLYLNTRQAGGETLRETLARFETEEAPRRKWQMRMRERLPMLDRSSY